MCCCTPWFTPAGTQYTKHFPLFQLSIHLSCSWMQLGLLFYIFYFTFLFLCAMSHALHKTLSHFLSTLSFISTFNTFKLLLNAARFVILHFLFYFIFMCNVTRTTQNTLPFLVYSFLYFNFQYISELLLKLQLGLLFYIFYFTIYQTTAAMLTTQLLGADHLPNYGCKAHHTVASEQTIYQTAVVKLTTQLRRSRPSTKLLL